MVIAAAASIGNALTLYTSAPGRLPASAYPAAWALYTAALVIASAVALTGAGRGLHATTTRHTAPPG